MPRPTRLQKVGWFLIGVLLVLGGLYGVFGCFVLAWLGGDIHCLYLIPGPLAVMIWGYVWMVQSVIVRSARK